MDITLGLWIYWGEWNFLRSSRVIGCPKRPILQQCIVASVTRSRMQHAVYIWDGYILLYYYITLKRVFARNVNTLYTRTRRREPNRLGGGNEQLYLDDIQLQGFAGFAWNIRVYRKNARHPDVTGAESDRKIRILANPPRARLSHNHITNIIYILYKRVPTVMI